MESLGGSLAYVLHHVFLPSKLPCSGDGIAAVEGDHFLLSEILEGLQEFAAIVGADEGEIIKFASDMIENLLSLMNVDGTVNEQALLNIMGHLPDAAVVPIYIKAQNAGLIIRRHDETVQFEALELSPSNEAVMGTKGRLVRCFPHHAVAVDLGTFRETGFQPALAQAVAKMSYQTASRMTAKAKKASKEHVETRDTTSPDLVTELLMSYLEASGRSINVKSTWKNTREEVLWSNSLLPWRRSPVWLLTRVALQSTLSSLTGNNVCYKEFMVFFMGRTLSTASDNGAALDDLHYMLAKISRRLLKLRPTVKSDWQTSLDNIVTKTTRLMKQRGDEIEAFFDPGCDLSELKKLSFTDDTKAQFPELDAYIDRIATLPARGAPGAFSPTPITVLFPSNEVPTLCGLPVQHAGYVLAAFETWVSSHLEEWMANELDNSVVCTRLSRAIREYHSFASQHYSGNPENVSIMLLTCLELWIACDKATAREHPLLLEYNPDIPAGLLQSLLLPMKSQMERLNNIEVYLASRRTNAQRDRPYILASFGAINSFSERYYQTSHDMQNLRAAIERAAHQERAQKQKELLERKETFSQLMSLHNSSACELVTVRNRRRRRYQEVHSNSCQRCAYRVQAESMQICLHEWPLPDRELEIRSTIFELDCPSTFSEWRNATVYISHNVLHSIYSIQESAELMYGPEACLRSYIRRTTGRISLRSKTKPHVVTHRRSLSVAIATEQDICVRNGLNYYYYDNEADRFVAPFSVTESVPKACMYQLQQNYQHLQDFLYRPSFRSNGPDANAVISEQSNCPDHMSLEEFKALAAICLGTRLQWQNIRVQLLSPSISFQKCDTAHVILQAIHQAGPPAGPDNASTAILREGHQDPYDESYGSQLLPGLQQALERIQDNWESYHALGSFIAIPTRLLSLTSSDEITTQYLQYLQQCRDTALKWIRLVRDKASLSVDVDQRAEFLFVAFEISHICAATFDVDQHHLILILGIYEEAASFIECSIAIHENTQSALRPGDMPQNMRHQRWQKLTSRVFPLLLDKVIKNESDYLDLAIKRSWSLYSRVSNWKPESYGHTTWQVAQSQSDDTSNPQMVHCNLLTGELLVDGLPLSRLPSSYEQHERYLDLFGRVCIEVMPSSMPGMEFSAMKPFRGHDLCFGLLHKFLSTPDLLLVSFGKSGRRELLPARLFQHKIPHHFVENFVHWYHPGQSLVEFRPLEDPWTSPASPYKLVKVNDEWTLKTSDDISLINHSSSTGKAVAHVLGCVESALYMHITINSLGGVLEISLPRLMLDFILHPQTSKIMSRQYKGFYLDEDSRLGTLTGLKSKVVLKDDQGNRLVLIPDGDASWYKTEQHVTVILHQSTTSKATPFIIDRTLGRLLDNGDLESKLQRCYLHALTAYCLPDPLTGRTGTEEALEILGSAAVRSFIHLTTRELGYLKRIARLTPRREFYPPRQRLMQTIYWNSHLSSLSQHGGLYQSVVSILNQAASLQFFQNDKLDDIEDLDHGDIFLLERDSIRSATFRRSGYGAEGHTREYDSHYKQRSLTLFTGEHKYTPAYTVARRAIQEMESTQTAVNTNLAGLIWRFLSASGVIPGPGSVAENQLIGYDAELISDWRKLLIENWCQVIHGLGQGLSRYDKFRKALFVATLAFADDVDMQLIQLLVSFITVPSMSQVSLPDVHLYRISSGHNVSYLQLDIIIRENFRPFQRSSESRLPQLPREPSAQAQNRRQALFAQRQEEARSSFSQALLSQWPCEIPIVPATNNCDFYINTAAAMESSKRLFQECFDNCRLYWYLSEISNILQSLPCEPLQRPDQPINEARPFQPSCQFFITTADLFSNTAPAVLSSKTDVSSMLLEPIGEIGDQETTMYLRSVIDRLDGLASKSYQKLYVQDLRKSIACLSERKVRFQIGYNQDQVQQFLWANLTSCRAQARRVYRALVGAVRAVPNLGYHSAAAMYNCPKATPIFFLSQLSQQSSGRLPWGWKRLIVAYGVAITAVQQAQRLLKVLGSPLEFVQELEDVGHKNWDPLEYPESLLIEVENGLLIREVQEEIATHMRDPPDGQNAVMQLHMGEGKSSVIVPIAAAALANRERLVRVVVAKPQFIQMHQTLVSKLGGLLGRRVYHMPFSRSLCLGHAEAQVISKTYRDCMNTGGILLVQPEQLLSFQLMGIEKVLTGNAEVARSLQDTQAFFNKFSRDIIDESDENFSVKFELVYTIGNQQPIELSPRRWCIIQEVLGILARLAVKHRSRSIELIEGPSASFPRIRILEADAFDDFQSEVIADICDYGLTGFPISRQSATIRDAVWKYIKSPDLSAKQISIVESSTFWTDSTKQPMLLLRGLFAGGILAFVLGQKRWKVNYGLDDLRDPKTLLAVPFRAKDSPSPRSEFSHPDVVIIMTCLSYYYGGLDDEHIFWSFEHLLKSDEPERDYSEWTSDVEQLPASFSHLVGINLKDQHQCVNQIFPYLRKSKALVDYFLSNIVFPKQMKEYVHKLSASGWDLGRCKPNPTTGFSGTNDSQHLLPLTVNYLHLPKQIHTNALVLQHILQSENSVQLLSAVPADGESDAKQFLTTVDAMIQPVQVILDVGSLIIELSNIEVAAAWLGLTPVHKDKQAVVFFDDSDELAVLDRKGRVKSLQTSPFARQLGSCLIYLDEAHTRGTDLKLPTNYRAAVTLGANLTKDRLVQACMRMRKLGKGQSVVFCISEEIQSKILALNEKNDPSSIDVSDVLIWAMHETQTDLRRSMPLWANQGSRFERQKMIWQTATNGDEIHITPAQAEQFLEDEAMSLDTRYRPRKVDHHRSILGLVDSPQRDAILDRCVKFDSFQFGSATLQEEQERELAPENEQERQIERPPPAKPLKHELRSDVVAFVRSGTITGRANPAAWLPAFSSLNETSAGLHLDPKQFPSTLLVTRDFARTVQLEPIRADKKSHSADAFQRPVQWILTSTAGTDTVKHMAIISPFEAHRLIPDIKKFKRVHLHAYSPRWNIAHECLDNLKLYPTPALSGNWGVPAELIILLNLFSGQLYFKSFDEYTEVCKFLGLAWKETEPGVQVQADGFMTTLAGKSKGQFVRSPTGFLMVLFTKIRRNCGSISRTHLGRVLEGDRLRESEFTE